MSTPSAPTALADGLDAIAHALARGVAQTSTSTSASAKSRERFDAMAGLIEHARDKNDAVRALRATEDALVACVVRPEGEMSATRASMTLGALYEATDGGSLYSRANELLDAATTSKSTAFAKASAFKALMRLGEKFGDKLSGNASAYARAACASVRPNDDARCRRAALRFLAATCEKSAGGLDGKGIAAVYKTLVRSEHDRSSGVRAAFVDAIGALALAWAASKEKGVVSASDLDITGVVDRILHALKDDSARVRDAASGALASVILACATVSVEDRMNNEDSSGEPRFARAVSTFLYGPFMNACRERSLMNQRVCLGVSRAWISFINRSVRGGITDHHEVVGFTVKTLLSHALDDDPHACACAIYIIRVGCLAKADEASLRSTLATSIEALSSTDACRLLIAARTAKDAIEVIGSVDDELWAPTLQSIVKALSHGDRNVQAEAALALRALALACPTKFVAQLLEAMAQLKALVAAVDEADSLTACGAAFHIATLVSIGAEFTCGLPSNILRDAVALGIKCATGPGSARVREGGWIVISACLVGSGATVASEMCGVSIKFALTATFDAVVESGVEGEPGEIYAAAAAAEALSAWLIGKQSESSSLIPLLLSGITATERILSARQISVADERAKSLFRFRMFELLNSVEDTGFYSELHGRIVALCQTASRSSAQIDERQPENFLKAQLSTEDSHLGPWPTNSDVNLDELHTFEGSADSPHPRVWIGLSETHAYPKARSMRAATRQAQGLQMARVFTASPELRMGILHHFLNTAHRVIDTPSDARELCEQGVFIPKKQNAIDVIQSKALSALGSPFKSRRTKSDGIDEYNERVTMLTLLSADVLSAVKHIVENTKTQDSVIMSQFKKVANVIRYAEFSSTQHWRAIAEITAYANALHPDSDSLVGETIRVSKDLLTLPADTPARNIAALSIAATFRNAGAMALRQACTPAITNLLQMSMQVDHTRSSHIWSAHGICVIGSHTGQSFVRDAEDSVNLALALADAPFLMDEDNGVLTRVTAARLVNTAVSAIGPDLDHDSLIFKRAESLIEILGESDEPAANLESTVFLQHIATFTPRTKRGRALLADLRVMLKTATDSSTTKAVMSMLRHLLERDSSNVASLSGLDAELLIVLDRESDPKTRRTIERCVELFVRDVCRLRPGEGMTNLSNVALYSASPEKNVSSISYDDDDDGGGDVDLRAFDDRASRDIERGAPKLSTRLFAAQLLSQVPSFVGEEIEHRNLAAARRSATAGAGDQWLALHSQSAFDVAYRLSVSPVMALHAPGLEMFSNLMDLWAQDEDPDSVADVDYRATFVLEQYQAQLVSAMRATDASNASLEAFVALLRLVSSALTSGITGDDTAMTQRLANVATKIARDWQEGTSKILCGKECNETVATQARNTLVVSIARITSSAPSVIPEDVLMSMNAKWIAAVRNPNEQFSDDEMMAIIFAISTIVQEQTDNHELVRQLCFKAIICGFGTPRPPSKSHVIHALRAAKNLISRQIYGLLPSEIAVIRDAVTLHASSEDVFTEVACFIEALTACDKIQPIALWDTANLLADIMCQGAAGEDAFCKMMITSLRLAKRSKRTATRVDALMQHLFTDPSLAKYRLSALRGIRLADSDVMLLALTMTGHTLAGCARSVIRKFYAKKIDGVAKSLDSMDFVTESLQTWAAAFLLLKDEKDDKMCLTSLAIFLAIAVDVTSPEGIPDRAIDTTCGTLASSILVRLAAACADPFRSVVGQLSAQSKTRLQTLLNFKPAQATAATPLKSLEIC